MRLNRKALKTAQFYHPYLCTLCWVSPQGLTELEEGLRGRIAGEDSEPFMLRCCQCRSNPWRLSCSGAIGPQRESNLL